MDPLLVVIVSFGLIFVVTATLGQGLGVARASMGPPMKAHSQLNVMLLISTFVIMPAVLIGLAALLPFDNQVKMAIIVLAICGGAPFVPWLVSLAKGNVGYSAPATTMLLLVTLVVLPVAIPPLEKALDTGADVTAWGVAWPLLRLHAAAIPDRCGDPVAFAEPHDGAGVLARARCRSRS